MIEAIKTYAIHVAHDFADNIISADMKETERGAYIKFEDYQKEIDGAISEIKRAFELCIRNEPYLAANFLGTFLTANQKDKE